MGKILKIAILCFAVLSLWYSCGDDGCVESIVGYGVGTLKKNTGSENSMPSSISVYGIGQQKDSAMIKGLSPSSTIDLLLNPSDTVTDFKVLFVFSQDTIIDTLRFHYENKDFFINIDCGCTVYHFVDSIEHTSNFIKTIEIINPEITNVKTNNFTIGY
ncbi:MAG: DUF6452 family protein [Bacteroidales bacterium]|nr:DUF6452 family protein [Bacteroidales bacterium]